jgi:CheY-like chemotaxis protein
MAGGVAHDFNNILAVIIGHGGLLVDQPDIGGTAQRHAQAILDAGRRAANLTRQLLAFSRKQLLQPRILNMNRIIEDIDKMIRRLIGDDIEMKVLLGGDLENVNADPSQMEQVILNFCVNARDAMPEGGRITIETKNADVDEQLAAQYLSMKPGRYVRIDVSDTGTGMDEETLSHIFEPFFTTKEPGKGTGLGLATVYGIVKQSGGQVWACSEQGRGSTFSIYLPAAIKEVEPRESEVKPLQMMLGTETILVVEDAQPLRALIREMLESFGYNVLDAGDGEQAYQIAEQNKDIALLLTDLSLPKINGLALAKSLLEKKPGLKVLYMSAHADVAALRDAQEVGASFLQKPFTRADLGQKLRNLFDNQGRSQINNTSSRAQMKTPIRNEHIDRPQ